MAGTPQAPLYTKVEVGQEGEATPTFMIVCDEGWRESIVCDGMYEWAADWLIGVLGRRPYVPEKGSRTR
jgi:hypothetical protein